MTQCRAGGTVAAPAPAPAPRADEHDNGACAGPAPRPAGQYSGSAGRDSTDRCEPVCDRRAGEIAMPDGTVVWANLNSKIYHFTGYKDYGNTKTGAYMCESDATSQGMRASKNEKHP